VSSGDSLVVSPAGIGQFDSLYSAGKIVSAVDTLSGLDILAGGNC
jgi:hypothetical protein